MRELVTLTYLTQQGTLSDAMASSMTPPISKYLREKLKRPDNQMVGPKKAGERPTDHD